MQEPTLWNRVTSGPYRARLRWALRIVTPWGAEWLLHRGAVTRSRARLRAIAGQDPVRSADSVVDAAVEFLVGRGLEEHEVRQGSMPEPSLRFLADRLADRLPADRPILALHVGNFVGVSLCFLSRLLLERHPRSLVVSVDPNIPHRGIADPQSHVLALLDHFGLLAGNVIITGYSLGRLEAEDAAFAPACERVLSALQRLSPSGFDLALLDGDHEREHLAGEVAAIQPLMRPGGIVAFDDIRDWGGVAAVFADATQDAAFASLGDDGRVGILQLVAP